MAKHTPQVFRPRPLDIDTPMPVIIQNDPDDEEELKTEKKFKKRDDRVIPIPIPIYHDIESYDRENSEWKRPDSYVIYHEKTPAELEETVEYEMDSEDERFVHTINDASNKVKSRSLAVAKKPLPPLLTDDRLEKMIDVLEKEAFRKIHKIPSRSFLDYLGNVPFKKKPGPKPAINAVLKDIEVSRPTDDVPCVVCNDEDWDESNMIVFCDGCDLAVHQTCYGVPQIPPADWYCRRCEKQGKGKGTRLDGATDDADKEKMKEVSGLHEDVDNSKEKYGGMDKDAIDVSMDTSKDLYKEKTKEEKEKEKDKSPRGRHRHKGKHKQKQADGEEEEIEEYKCVLCGHRGGAVKPTADGKWAHVLCALWLPDASFLDATIMEPIDTAGISKDRFGLTCEICGTQEGCCIQCRTRYCYTAFHPFCAAQADYLMEMRPAKGRPNSLLFKTHCIVHSKEIRAERGMEKNDKYSDIITQVCSEEIKIGLHKLVGVPLAVADAVCNFWLAKRQKAKHKDRPLLSRLQMEEDALRHAAKKKRSNLQRTIQTGEEQTRLRELRCQMDRALIILDVLKKREIYKREYVRNLQEIFETLVQHNEYNFTGDSTHCKATLPSSSDHSSPSTTELSPTTSTIKRTPTKGTQQLTIDSFLSRVHNNNSNNNNKNNNTIANTDNSLFFHNNTTNGKSSSPKQRRLRDKTSLIPIPIHPSTPPTPRSARRRIIPPTSPTHSSSDESLALPGRSGTPDHARSYSRSGTPDRVRSRRSNTPDRSRTPRRSRSPSLPARRSRSPNVASSSEEGEASGPDSDTSSSENEDMVPKSRAHLRRAANKGSIILTAARKRRRKV